MNSETACRWDIYKQRWQSACGLIFNFEKVPGLISIDVCPRCGKLIKAGAILIDRDPEGVDNDSTT